MLSTMIAEKRSLYTDITHSIGIPFGGLGTGYFVYGKSGFSHLNFDGYPEMEQTCQYPRTKIYLYDDDNPKEEPLALYIEKDSERTLLQARTLNAIAGKACTDFEMHTFVPFGYCKMVSDEATDVELLMYSSVKPHDVNATSIPACVFEMRVTNRSDKEATYTLGLDFDRAKYQAATDGKMLTLTDANGHVCFGFENGQGGKVTLTVAPGASVSTKAAIGWYYPTFQTTGISLNDIMVRQGLISADEIKQSGYVRHYVTRFSSAADAVELALSKSAEWKNEIIKWHQSMDMPEDYMRLWFGSYASVITATLYTEEGYYLEIEQPHGCLNTMDVSVYSTWLFMINWPEIERRDLDQYVSVIPREGDTAGKVWHSLWEDGAHYVEESIYVLRVWRYALWSHDIEFLDKAFDTVRLAMEYAYKAEGYGSLINNVGGNQSYDAWKMPGIGAYVNNQWIYALLAYAQICRTLNRPMVLCGRDLDEFIKTAVKEYNEHLWDEEGGYWHAYRPNEKSNQLPFGNAVFTDQLFGQWAIAIDPASRHLLDNDREISALKKIYTHNRIIEKKHGYSCWANGVLPDKVRSIEIHDMNSTEISKCGYHAWTCWVSTQMAFASLLAYFGLEEESADVFHSFVESVGRNIAAVGEWNCAIDKDGNAINPMPLEPGKDTPRFPPYPRYKSSWEYVIRMLGMTMDFDNMYFAPLKNCDFKIENVILANMKLSVRVEKGWTRCLVNGKEAEPTVARSCQQTVLEFIK